MGSFLFSLLTSESIKLLPTGEGEFMVKDLNFLVTFDPGPNGRPRQFSFQQSGTLTTATRVDTAESRP
jgi:hypothetical protein